MDKPDTVFEEIKSDVRKDQLMAFWNKHQKAISNLAFILVLAIGGYWFWSSRQEESHLDASNTLYQAMMYGQHDKNQEAIKQLETISKKSGYAYADLSKLYGASLFAKMDNRQDAQDSLETLIKKTNIPIFKDIALLKKAQLEIDAGTDLDAAEDSLKPLLAKKESPWFFMAKELEVALRLKQGNMENTRLVLTELLQNDKTPSDIKSRARLLQAELSSL